MSDPLQDFLDTYKPPAKGKAGAPAQAADPIWDDIAALEKAMDAEEAAKASAPPPAPTASAGAAGSERATTTATTQREANREAFKRGTAQDARSLAMPALGFGIARGGTLGLVDRGIGLGTDIGEGLASAFNATAPADPNAGARARTEYLQAENRAAQANPGLNIAGELAGGMVPTLATGGLNRFAQAGALGGVAGMGNTVSNEPIDLAKGAGLGVASGLAAEGTLGTLFRRGVRKAPVRQENAILRDAIESDAGRATPTQVRRLVMDVDDVRDVIRTDKELADVVRLPAKDAAPLVEAKASAAMAGQSGRYDAVDKALDKKPMTVTALLQKIVDAEQSAPAKIGPAVAKALEGVRDDIRTYWAPRWGGLAEWNGQRVPITSQQLREWVSSTQASAAMKMGSINGTVAFEVPNSVAILSNKILEERLDQAAAKGAKAAVDGIREADRKYSAIMRLAEVVDGRAMKEMGQSIGLTQRIDNANSRLAVPALLAAGQFGAAAAIAARKPMIRAGEKIGAFANDKILAPMQRAAEAGSQAAIAERAAFEGIPQVSARAAQSTIAPQSPTIQQMLAGRPPVSQEDRSGYRTSTAVR